MIFKFVIRNLLKRPFLNLLKVIGLSLALSSILLILLFLKNELTYDSFYEKSSRIFRITISDPSFIAGKHFARISNAEFIPAMAEYFPEVENYVRLAPVRGGVVKYNENFILVNQAFECDSTFFEIFDAGLITGNAGNLLDAPGSMVISESFAKKAFGTKSPIGETLTLPIGQFNAKETDFTVKGIMKDFPQNSHLHPDFITTPVDKNALKSWAWTYLLLRPNANPENIKSGFKNFISSQKDDRTGEIKIDAHLQRITDIHLHSDKLREIEPNSNMSVIYTLAAAAFILLFIAVTNYINLNIGMAVFSDKYLFISKVSGATVWMSLKYFLFEGILIVMSAIVCSGFILTASHVLIQRYVGMNLFEGNIAFIISFVTLFSLLGILSGILPLMKQGVRNVKSSTDYRNNLNYRRKGLSKSIIVLQYTISIALIIAVLVIRRQTNYAIESGMGFESDNLICFNDVHASVQQKFEIFKEELLKYNSIESVSAMFEPPGGEANDMFQFKMEGYAKNEANNADNFIGVFPCDYSFASIFNLSFLSGSNFSEKNEDNEGSGEYIINESAMKRLQYTNPSEIIGRSFALISNIEGIILPEGKIIGVVEDFHLSSIKKEIEPLVMFKRKELWLINFVVLFKQGMLMRALSDTENVWTKMFPGYPFQYEYVSSMYRKVYKSELLLVKLLSLFTFIALFICSMGLLGMSLLITQRRTKEIGLRKINGAGTGEIMVMLNSDFMKWILLSFILAIPIAVYAINRWLENFAYTVSVSWWIFGLAGLSALFIAALTVSIQSWKSSARNPVETLKYE